jgi:hypothetical protein
MLPRGQTGNFHTCGECTAGTSDTVDHTTRQACH